MHTPPPARVTRPHPLLLAAALAVVLFCLIGSAAILGWLPSSRGDTSADRLAATTAPAVPAPEGARAPGPLAPGMAPQALSGAAPAGDATLVAAAPPVAPLVATAAPARAAAPAPSHSNWCGNCGNIESVRTITTRASGSGVGAAGGAILGGLLGNQIGDGHGRQVATVAGAVGGAVLGNQVEGNMRANQSYEIRVRMDDGALRTFHQNTAPDWRSGERVKIVKGRLRRA